MCAKEHSLQSISLADLRGETPLTPGNTPSVGKSGGVGQAHAKVEASGFVGDPSARHFDHCWGSKQVGKVIKMRLISREAPGVHRAREDIIVCNELT